jgi:hypothetical protein
MISLDGVLIDEEILYKKFSCDLSKCKGACCTFYGDFGAPLLDEEVPKIRESFNVAEKYLSKSTKEYIRKKGYIEGIKGNYSTVCINKKDCVFVFYKNDIAFCSLEQAYLNGETTFRKPLSCHLFPIRIADWNNGQLYFSEIEECKTARKKGEKENIFLYETAKDALIRKFGYKWYENFVNYIKFTINSNK